MITIVFCFGYDGEPLAKASTEFPLENATNYNIKKLIESYKEAFSSLYGINKNDIYLIREDDIKEDDE